MLSELMSERALTSFTICDAYRYFAICVTVIGITKKVTHKIFNTNG